MILDLRYVDRPAVHGVAAFGKASVDEILRGVLLSPHRREADQLLGEGDLCTKSVIDSGENLGSQRVIEGRRI